MLNDNGVSHFGFATDKYFIVRFSLLTQQFLEYENSF